MNVQARRIIFLSALTLLLSAVSAFIVVSTFNSAYADDFAGPDTKDWVTGAFTRNAYMMIILYVTAVVPTVWALVVYYYAKPPLRPRWLVVLFIPHFCQFYSFGNFQASFYLIMKFDMFGDNVTPQVIRLWDIFDGFFWVAMGVYAIVILACTFVSMQPLRGSPK